MGFYGREAGWRVGDVYAVVGRWSGRGGYKVSEVFACVAAVVCRPHRYCLAYLLVQTA